MSRTGEPGYVRVLWAVCAVVWIATAAMLGVWWELAITGSAFIVGFTVGRNRT